MLADGTDLVHLSGGQVLGRVAHPPVVPGFPQGEFGNTEFPDLHTTTVGVIMPRCQCPTCGKGFDATETAAMPFCCDRCRLIDLGRWLDEKYAVPLAGRTPFGEDEADPDTN